MSDFEQIKDQAMDVVEVATEFKSEDSEEKLVAKGSEILSDVMTLNATELASDVKDVVAVLEDHAQVGGAVTGVVKEGSDVISDVYNIAGVFADGKVTPDEIPTLFSNVMNLTHDIPEALAALVGLKDAAAPVVSAVEKEAAEVVDAVEENSVVDALKGVWNNGFSGESLSHLGSTIVDVFYHNSTTTEVTEHTEQATELHAEAVSISVEA